MIGNNSQLMFGSKNIYLKNGRLLISDFESINCSNIHQNAIWPLGELVQEHFYNVNRYYT